jgi:DNA-binding NtrC family response regulator
MSGLHAHGAHAPGGPGRSRDDAPELQSLVAHALERTPFREAKRRVVTAFERAYLLEALRRHGGNVSRTARSIGMVRQSLQQKIREHGLRSEDWVQATRRGGTN